MSASTLPLKSLEIRNFRCFEHLVIEKLGRVNLIVGKNSVGKTSFLEAINLYATKAPPHQLFLTLLERGDVYPKQPDNILVFENFGSLFPDQKSGIGATIEIGELNNEHNRISVQIVYCAEDPNNPLRVKEIDSNTASELDAVKLGIKVKQGSKHSRIFQLPLSANPNQYGLLANYPANNCDFISSSGFNPALMPIYWDQILLEGQESEATELLKIIDPDIERIYMITSSDNPFGRVPFAKTKKFEKPIQIKNHGDGVRRVFGLALSLTKTRNGYLLVDEIENGLYHGIQTSLWRHIFRLAKECNTQVFATTHSWDCVEAFQEAAAEDENEEAMLIRLQRKRDGSGIEAESYNEPAMKIVTEQGIEVR